MPLSAPPPVAVVPAAGASRRMGKPKLLLPWGEGTVVGATVAALRQGGAATVALVVAPGARELARWAREAGLLVAVNPRPVDGMLASVREGIAALAAREGPRDAVLLVCPADLPALTATTVAHLLAAHRRAGAPLAVPTYRGRRGHPLAVAPRLIAEIAALDPAVGLRQLLDRHPGEVLEVAVDDRGAVRDLDTPGDYAALAPPGR